MYKLKAQERVAVHSVKKDPPKMMMVSKNLERIGEMQCR